MNALERKSLSTTFSHCSDCWCWSRLQLSAQKNRRMEFTPPSMVSQRSSRAARSTRPATTLRHRYPAAAPDQRISMRFKGDVLMPCFLPLFSGPTSSRWPAATWLLWLSRVRTAGGWSKEMASVDWCQDLTSLKCDPNEVFFEPHYFICPRDCFSFLHVGWRDCAPMHLNFDHFVFFHPPFLPCLRVWTLGRRPERKAIEWLVAH